MHTTMDEFVKHTGSPSLAVACRQACRADLYVIRAIPDAFHPSVEVFNELVERTMTAMEDVELVGVAE